MVHRRIRTHRRVGGRQLDPQLNRGWNQTPGIAAPRLADDGFKINQIRFGSA